jgi:predicted transcriptional regulator of viral defense system
MRYLELRESLKGFTVFSLSDIRAMDSSFHRRRLNEWQEKGYIRKIIKGYYMFSDMELNEDVLFEIANRIYSPSYISLEMALSYYHLIPESVYGITSIATRKTYRFKTEVAEFSYRMVKPALFFGFELVRYDSKVFKIAMVEKALLDYLYLMPHLKTDEHFSGMRLDKDMFFEQVGEERIDEYLTLFASKALTRRVSTLWRFLENA